MPSLETIAHKIAQRERLDFEDGVTLFRHPNWVAVGQLAHAERTRRHGDLAYFNRNMRIEVTNVCVASCTVTRPPVRWTDTRTKPNSGIADVSSVVPFCRLASASHATVAS